MSMIELSNVDKIYQSGRLFVPALLKINLKIEKGEMIAIMGPSGSGKSTLMNIIGLLDRPSEGELKIEDSVVDLSMSDSKLAKLRGKRIGFVFQTFNLLPKMSALANVLVPANYQANKSTAKKRALELLNKVGLNERAHHKPTELSGGERQRVAIARALINNPDVILADEPTGNLDSHSGAEIMQIFHELNKEGKTVIVITHDQRIANQCQRIVHLLDGQTQGKS